MIIAIPINYDWDDNFEYEAWIDNDNVWSILESAYSDADLEEIKSQLPEDADLSDIYSVVCDDDQFKDALRDEFEDAAQDCYEDWLWDRRHDEYSKRGISESDFH